MNLRLLTYTPYGPMVGCLACGTSWLVKDPGHFAGAPAQAAQGSSAN
jgi:hypothetical protein